ncbi:MAG: PRC-barrel domain-containing protein [Acetobacteraceae bacterium]|nr:PRC-barrel domain-containing protein [Acetobacteraceae bacterium]
MILLAALMAVPVLAQQSPPTGAAPDQTGPAASPAAPAAPPAPAPASQPANPPGVVATTNNPNLAVASVKLENGIRASKLIGASVRTDGDQEVGKVDDLVMTEGNKVTVAVVAVGGFLGLGSKLVAFPFDQLRISGDHVLLPGVSKDSLNAMPNFQYQ